jgi:ATP-binding cassette subfamily B protein/subfamily B ATP-binding cassette protein MsbA
MNTFLPAGNGSIRIVIQLLRYAIPYRLPLAVAILLLSANLTMDVGFAWVQQLFIDTINSSDMNALLRLILICGAFCVAITAGMMLQHYYRHKVHAGMVQDAAGNLFDHSNRLPFRSVQAMHSGDLVSRNGRDVDSAVGAVGNIVFELGYNLLLCIVAFCYLVGMNAWLALLAIGSGPVVFFAGRFFDRRLRRLSERIQQKEAEVRSLLQETLQGMKVVRAFGMEEALLTQFVNTRHELNGLLRKRAWWNALLWQSSALVNNVIMVVCAVLVALSAVNGIMSAGGVLAFVILIGRVQWPFVGMSQTWGRVQESLGAADRVFEIMAMPSEESSPASNASGERQTTIIPSSMQSSAALLLRGVSLTHPSPESGPSAVLFDGLDLTVEQGEMVAIVGPSGSGKTTLARLCCGLYQPDIGTVEVCGRSLAKRLDEARQQLTYVPQTPYLFSGTIRENIAFGTDGASDDEIKEAARLAGADVFIANLPDGYSTMLGEHGSTLSGGQRQRIAIARAFLRQAPLLILDEATSALDNESEQLIQQSLNRLMQGRTTLVIAHRLSTVRNATRIIVMDNGRIMEQGNHLTLMAQDGLYAHLYRLQFKEQKPSYQPNV